MASFATLQVQGSLMRSQFLGQDYHLTHHHFPLKQTSTAHHRKPNSQLQPRAEFNIVKMMGGRGLCNGEIGIQQELERQVDDHPPPPPPLEATAASSSGKEQLENSDGSAKLSTTTTTSDGSVVAVSEDAFEKEMMGLTGGFPGGEKGLIKFIQENPPPHKSATLFTLSL